MRTLKLLSVLLVCLALSAVSVYRSRETTYEMNQNALGFYMDQLALRHELGDIDAVTDFPSALAPRLTLLYWNAGTNDPPIYNGGTVYAATDEGQTFKILPDGSWEDLQASFDQLPENEKSTVRQLSGEEDYSAVYSAAADLRKREERFPGGPEMIRLLAGDASAAGLFREFREN